MESAPIIGCAGGRDAGCRVPPTTLVGVPALRLTPVREVDPFLPEVVDVEPLPRNAFSALAAILEESLAPTERGSLHSGKQVSNAVNERCWLLWWS